MNKNLSNVLGFMTGMLFIVYAAHGLSFEEEHHAKEAALNDQSGLLYLERKERKMPPLYREGEVLIKFKKGISLATARNSCLIDST